MVKNYTDCPLQGCSELHLPCASISGYRGSVTATLSADIAASLGLSAAGDEAYLEVTAVNADGSVEVMAEESDEPETESPDMAIAKKALTAVPVPAPMPA